MKPLKLELIFGARDRLSPALRAMVGGSKATNQALKKTRDELKALEAQQKQIEGYTKQKKATMESAKALQNIQTKIKALRQEMAINPSNKLTQEFDNAVKKAKALKEAHNQNKQELQQLRNALKDTGLSSHNLADQQNRLKQKVNDASSSLDQQKKKLENLNRIQESSKKIKHNAQMGAMYGAGMMATGATAAYALTKPINESKHYEIEKNRIGALGVGTKTTNEIIAFSKAMKTFGTSTTENLTLARDALTIFGGDVHHAEMAAPMLAKMKFANETMYGQEQGAENEKKFMDTLKVIELRGGLKNEAAFKEQANMLQQVITATGGRVQGEEWLNAIKTGGIAAKGLDNKAFYYKMEPIIQEMGGFRTGTAMMSAYQNLYQGRTTQKSVRALDKYGLLGDKSKVHHDKIGNASFMDIGAVKNAALFKKDQFAWMEEVLIPQLASKGITKESDVLDAIGNIFSNRTASNLFATMYQQRGVIHKNMKLNEGAENIDQLSDRAKNTTAGKELEAKAKLHDAYLELGNTILPIYTQAMEMATNGLRMFTEWMDKNPTSAKALGIGLMVIATSLLAIGGALVVFSPLIAGMMSLRLVMASFSMLSAVFSPFLLAITLLAVAAFLIYQNWEPIKAFFLETWESVSKWANETWQVITKGAGDAWNGVCGFFGGIGEWFTDKWNKVTTSTQEVWNSITTGASDAWNGITDGISSTWNTIKNTFNQGVNWVIQTFTALWTKFKSIINSVDQVFARNPLLNFLIPYIGIPRMIIANWSSIKGFFADVWNGVVQSTSNAWNSICAFFSPIGQWFSTQWGTVKTSANTTWQSIKTGANDAWNSVCEYFSPVGDWFADRWNQVAQGASTAWEATKAGASSSYNTITEVFAPVTNWFTDRWNDIKKAFDGGLIGIGALIMNWSPLGLFYKAFASVLNWFGIELPSTFSGFGSMIIDGLVSGIEKGFDKLKATWEKVNSWMPDWTRKTMDIHSPSRVMAGLGRFIVDGLSVGVDQGHSPLKDKFNNLLGLFTQNTPQTDLQTKLGNGLQAVKDIAIEPIIAKIRPIHLTPQGNQQVQHHVSEGDITVHIHAQAQHSAQDIALLVRQEISRLKREEQAKQRTSFWDQE